MFRVLPAALDVTKVFQGEQYVKLHTVILSDRARGGMARVRNGQWSGRFGSQDLLRRVSHPVHREPCARAWKDEGLTARSSLPVNERRNDLL